MGYSFRLTAMVLLYAPSHRQDNTYHGLCYTSSGALAGTRNSSMGPLHEGSIRRPIVPWANALTTDLHLAPCDYEFSDEYFLDERDLVSTWNISAPPTPPPTPPHHPPTPTPIQQKGSVASAVYESTCMLYMVFRFWKSIWDDDDDDDDDDDL